jgi:hypothetical protein
MTLDEAKCVAAMARVGAQTASPRMVRALRAFEREFRLERVWPKMFEKASQTDLDYLNSIKEAGDAVSVEGADGVDVREPSPDGQEVGEGDPERQESAQEEGETPAFHYAKDGRIRYPRSKKA